MKQFLPYLKYLKPVRARFALAIICGTIYAAASGFGLPFMTSKVFPILFSSNTDAGVTLAVKPTELSDSISKENTSIWSKLKTNLSFSEKKQTHFILGNQDSFSHIANLYTRQEGKYTPLPSNTILNTEGTYTVENNTYSMGELFFSQKNSANDSTYIKIEPSLYMLNSKGELANLKQNSQKKDNVTLLLAVLMLPAVFFIRGIAGYFNTYLITYCGQTVLESLRRSVFEKLQHVDLDFFQKYGTGDLMARIMTGSSNLQRSLTAVSNDLIKQPLTFLGALAALVYLSLQHKQILFILMCLIVIPVVIIPLRKLSKHMLDKVRKGEKGESAMANCLQENITAARDIRSFNLQSQQLDTFSVATRSYFKMIIAMTRYRAAMSPMVEVITTIGVSVAIYYSAKNGLSLDQVLALIVALYISYEPLKKIAALQPQIISGSVAISRLETILNAPIITKEPENPVPFENVQGQIEFSNVHFSYDTKDKQIAINNISTTIHPEETIALVGTSGAGKSTFTHLIPRSYDVDSGQILLDGINVKSIAKETLRDNISIVAQDPYLFNTTIAENIRLGKQDATKEEIEEAAKMAFAHDFILSLPKKYNTIVGEKATRLSGGQRQRVAIARAFLKNAPILILDEATSALDAESEQAIQLALDKLVKGKTTLIIAHRFSSIRNADRILVFENGAIISTGSHHELIEKCSRYQELYKKQIL